MKEYNGIMTTNSSLRGLLTEYEMKNKILEDRCLDLEKGGFKNSRNASDNIMCSARIGPKEPCGNPQISSCDTYYWLNYKSIPIIV